MELLAGTSGYSYKEWKGPFYPEKLPQTGMLAYYAGRLPAVEINNTFYRLPRASVLETWADQVPDGFRFAIKASRRITHFKRLLEAEDETGYLLRTVATLGDRLGVLLFQLPPNARLDLERLTKFLEVLPQGTRAAFEFRHTSWCQDEVYERLRERDCAWVVVDNAPSDSADAMPNTLVSTASWGYLRLRGADYDRADLADWASRIAAQGWERAFVFFKHEDEGEGPKLAASFLEIAGRAEQRKPAAHKAGRKRATGRETARGGEA